MNILPSTDGASIYEFWLLDASGRVLGHDSLADKITARDFIPQKHPGLTIHTNASLPLLVPRDGTESPKCEAVFHKRLSLPFPLPDMMVFPSGPGLIALRQMEGGQHWMGSPKEGGDVYFNSEEIGERERFLPLSRKAFTGLSYLCDSSLSHLATVAGEGIPPAHLLAEPACYLALGGQHIPLTNNLEQLEQISYLPFGKEYEISFTTGGDPAETLPFFIQRVG